MKGLTDKKVGVAAERSAGAIQTLIEKQGGKPVVYSIQGRQQLNEETSLQNVKVFLEEDFDWAILTTGIGIRTLADAAGKEGLAVSFIEKLSRTRLAVRGSKTLSWLKENGLEAEIVSEDGTMENLLQALEAVENGGRKERVFLQAYNEDDAKLEGALEAAGYSVYLSQPYSYEEPEAHAVSQLKAGIINHTLDVVIFTSKTQINNLFAEQADREKLIASFNGPVLAAAVGKVSAQALESRGITRVVQPESQKMGALIIEVTRYYQQAGW